jgi:hypothetical protein
LFWGKRKLNENTSLYHANPLKHKVHVNSLIFKDSVRTAKKTPHFTITKINWLTLFKEMVDVYSENHTKHLNTLIGQNAGLENVKAGGTSSYLCAFKKFSISLEGLE